MGVFGLEFYILDKTHHACFVTDALLCHCCFNIGLLRKMAAEKTWLAHEWTMEWILDSKVPEKSRPMVANALMIPDWKVNEKSTPMQWSKSQIVNPSLHIRWLCRQKELFTLARRMPTECLQLPTAYAFNTSKNLQTSLQVAFAKVLDLLEIWTPHPNTFCRKRPGNKHSTFSEWNQSVQGRFWHTGWLTPSNLMVFFCNEPTQVLASWSNFSLVVSLSLFSVLFSVLLFGRKRSMVLPRIHFE